MNINIQTLVLQQTPLHIACANSCYTSVKILCENGADLFLTDSNGKTPFTSVSNNLLLIKMLKKYESKFFTKKY